MPTFISISIDPTDLEFTSGDRYDPEKLLAAIREFALEGYPDAKFPVLQIGHKQGDCWSRVNGDEDVGEELMLEFWEKRGTDRELLEEAT